MNSQRRNASGFTLLELVVVLAILAALATVALRSAEGLDDRVRFDATRRTLEETRDAILGVRTADGFRPGFLSDLEALPAELGQLLLAPDGVAASHVETDGAVALATGWRGPYLTLGPGAAEITDGWGRPLVLDVSDGDYVLGSLGADGFVGGAGYDTDLQVALVVTDAALDLAASSVTLVVRLESLPAGYDPATDDTLTLSTTLFAPDPASGALAADTESALVRDLFPGLDQDDLPLTHTRTVATTAGARAVRAELGTDVLSHTSRARTLVLPHGATVIELVLD